MNGLQQGTVNAPVFSNLHILDLIKNTKNIIAFADDLVIYHADKSIYNINNNLEGTPEIRARPMSYTKL